MILNMIVTFPNGYTDVVEMSGCRGRLIESYCDGVSKVNFKGHIKLVKSSELKRFTPEELPEEYKFFESQ